MKVNKVLFGLTCMLLTVVSLPTFAQEEAEDTTYESMAPAEATPTPSTEEVPINWGGEDTEGEDYGDF